jgi:serine/threonine protein kinase
LWDEDRGGEYSEASDVWSFGVVLYEMIMARAPSADDFNDDECRRLFEESRIAQMIVTKGYAHLVFPINSPDIFKKIMKMYDLLIRPQTNHIFFRCWAMKPKDRPNFARIKKCLYEFATIGTTTPLDRTHNNESWMITY